MNDPWETFEHAGLTVKLWSDDDAGDPRKEFDNVGEMVHWHRDYDLGDRKIDNLEADAMTRRGFPLLSRYLFLCHNAAVVLPLGLLDHSGLTMWVGGGSHWSDSAGWDSGTVGFIWCTHEDVQREWNGDVEAAERYLRGEVSTYDAYLTNRVAGYTVEDEDGEVLDSCWGFYPDDEGDGFEYVRQEARSFAEHHAEETRKAADVEARERAFWANADLATVEA